MRRTTGLLILAILAGLLWSSRSRPDGTSDGAPPGADFAEAGPAAGGGFRIDTVAFDAAACSDAGYLCEGLAAEGESRAIRWPDGTGALTVRVPAPDGVDAASARALQRQAAAGIREWQGRPLPLTVTTSRSGPPADVEVRWVRALDGGRVGEATVRWQVGPRGAELAVMDFVLATHTPEGRPLDPGRLRLTAAHEMGHVLGLPHSDDPADVMYRFNTATRLTYRDFRTLEVLYDLPAGARVERRDP